MRVEQVGSGGGLRVRGGGGEEEERGETVMGTDIVGGREGRRTGARRFTFDESSLLSFPFYWVLPPC